MLPVLEDVVCNIDKHDSVDDKKNEDWEVEENKLSSPSIEMARPG